MAQPIGSGSIKSQIDEAQIMADSGSDAIVVLPPTPVMTGKFYSCHFEKAGFKKETHGPYYYNYLKQISDSLSVPIIFHDKPIQNGLGLPLEWLDQIMMLDNVKGIKVHSQDPCSMEFIYNNYSNTKLCFDGFGKTVQFWSMVWGAKVRHSCWSWFDSKSDQKFYQTVTDGKYSEAIEIINCEWKLANVIKATGFGGYKELMRINNIIDNNLTREPGIFVSNDEANLLSITYQEYLRQLSKWVD